MFDELVRLTVVLLSDNLTINGSFRAALEAEGWQWVDVTSIEALLRELLSRNSVIAIIASTLNHSVVDHIRSLSTTQGAPVVVFCANHRTAEICEALDAGAEDVISIPFSHTEAVARLRAVARVRFGTAG